MTVFSGFYALKKKAYKKTVSGFIPDSLVIPVTQDKWKNCRLLVNEGDTVTEGQLIAASSGFDAGRSMVYAPLPGVVEKIVQCTCPDGKTSDAVKLKFQGGFRYTGKKLAERDTSALSAQTLISEIGEKGIVNTFVTDKPVPLAAELEKGLSSPKRILVVRLFDDDPSRLTDLLVSSFFLKEVFAGADLCARAMDAKKIVFIKSKDFDADEKTFHFSRSAHFFPVDIKRYPAGFKKEICKTVKKLSGAHSSLRAISEGDLFTDSSTMYDLYRTVSFGMPLMDKFVHVSGECVPASGMIQVKTGVSFRSLAEQCGGFIKKPGALIVNGIITGSSAESLDAPVTKYVKSVSFLPSSRVPHQLQSVCIRCGNCRRECPCALSPDVLYRHVKGVIAAAKPYVESMRLCSSCGSCNAVCPARLPICQTIASFNESRAVKEDLYESSI
ncbi:MAG: 4Fe-4S dicluster domain-containing protein [Treponema sp.]